jgi:ADP-heptose:LPS heptosyltransferase
MKTNFRNLYRTPLRYLYFRLVQVLDILLNSDKPLFPLEKVSTILLVEVQDIGDTIVASPCIRQVRKRFPKAAIYMLVQNKSIDMVQYNPNLDQVIGVRRITSYPQLIRVCHTVRKKQYDLVISLSPSVRNNLIATLSGGKIISGYLNDYYFRPTNYHDHPIEVRGHKSTEAVTYFKEESLRIRALKPASFFGINLCDWVDTELFLPEEADAFANEFLKRHQIHHHHILVGMHPVCLNYYRNWPAEKFAELSDRLVAYSKSIRIFLIGSKEDRGTFDLIESLMEHKNYVIHDSTLTLVQSAFIINHCDVLVGTDSSPSHISGALKIPTVHLHGPTDPKVTGPGGTKNTSVVLGLPCSPCGLIIHFCPYDKRCMRELEVSKVLEAIIRAIEKYNPQKCHHLNYNREQGPNHLLLNNVLD